MEGPSETLGDEFPCVKESFKVPHMDLKDFCNDYFTSLNVPTTFLYVSFYYDNFIKTVCITMSYFVFFCVLSCGHIVMVGRIRANE